MDRTAPNVIGHYPLRSTYTSEMRLPNFQRRYAIFTKDCPVESHTQMMGDMVDAMYWKGKDNPDLQVRGWIIEYMNMLAPESTHIDLQDPHV